MCFISGASRLVFFIYGTLGPAYHTYKTLNNGDDEFLAWAKYWIVYAFLVTIELLTDALMSWMAIYMPIKLIFMLWIVLSAPTANVWMFDAILHPILAKRQEQIDKFLKRGKYTILNEFFRAVSLMCAHGRTFMRPLISHLWPKASMALGDPNNLETEGGGAGNDKDSVASCSSLQTSTVNVCNRTSPLTSLTRVNNHSQDTQFTVHSDRSINELAENIISPEASSATVRRQVPRNVNIFKVPKKESASTLPSQTNLTTQKIKLYDDVEDLLATSRVEPDGQDVRQHRQLASRNRAVISQQ